MGLNEYCAHNLIGDPPANRSSTVHYDSTDLCVDCAMVRLTEALSDMRGEIDVFELVWTDEWRATVYWTGGDPMDGIGATPAEAIHCLIGQVGHPALVVDGAGRAPS